VIEALPGFFSACHTAIEKTLPGLSRHCRERAVLTRTLLAYRTPANHHLRRALRLSWIRAASTIVGHRERWARKHRSRDDALAVLSFIPVFDRSRNRIVAVACNQDSEGALDDSPIDDSLEAILDGLGAHLRDSGDNEVREHVTVGFGKVLGDVTDWSESELPTVILEDARLGVSRADGERRTFGHLLFDEFARVVQEPDLYPEAAASFQVVQRKAIEEFVGSLRREIEELATDLRVDVSEALESQLALLSPEWMGDVLREHRHEIVDEVQRVGDAVDASRLEIINRFDRFEERWTGRDAEVRETRTVDAHTPSRDRTVVFAGYLDKSEMAVALDESVDLLSRRAGRDDPDAAFVPLNWDFSSSTERETVRSPYTRSEAWQTIDDSVIGAVLVLDDTLRDSIDPDDDFVETLQSRGWLEPDGPVHDLLEARSVQRLRAIRDGAIPITYETRFAIECLAREKPLIVVLPRRSASEGPSVKPFLALLLGEGVPVVSLADGREQKSWVDEFLASVRLDPLDAVPNPYHGLDYYQIEDAYRYVGRKPEAAQAIAHLTEAMDEGRGAFLGVRGPSGCGKSSFIRARVAAGLQDARGVDALELRPTDFRLLREASIRTLPHLCKMIAAEIGIEAPGRLVGREALFRTAHLPLFKVWLRETIDPDAKPVIVCLDQFEEIVDDLSEGVHEGEWRALLDVLGHLCAEHRWLIVFTLESSRQERFDRIDRDLGWSGVRMIDILDSDEDFYRSVIVKPFLGAGIELGGDIVEELLGEVKAHQNDIGASSSALPLLALGLRSLFERLSRRARRREGRSSLGGSFDRVSLSLADLEGVSLALGDMVADLAESAWRQGNSDNDPEDLGHFLRPLVRVSLDANHADGGKLVLQTIGERTFRTEKKLQAEFRKRRVLVPSGSGVRLVHEAVVTRWPRAKRWLDEARLELESEAAFRADALRWNERGKPEVADPPAEQIDRAARLLSAQIREWSMAEAAALDVQTEVLRQYATKVFSRSTTPLAWVFLTDSVRGNAHVHVAAAYGLDDLLTRFLELDPDTLDLPSGKSERTPLAQAAWGHRSTVKVLLEAGANAELRDKSGFCALDSAVWAGEAEIVDLILAKVSPDNWGDDRVNPIGGAAATGRIDIAERLAGRGFRYEKPGLQGWTPLHHAATRDDVECFRYFLGKGRLDARWRGDDGEIDRTPFDVAAANGCVNIVRHLLSLEEGIALLGRPGRSGETPLTVAALHHSHLTVEQLIEVMTDVNGTLTIAPFDGFTALHLALVGYAHARADASDHVKRTTRRTVRALLVSERLDVMVEAADGSMAWTMAVGMPDLQREISMHPSFSEGAFGDLRRKQLERDVGLRRKELYQAAAQGEALVFDALLENFDATERVDSVDDFRGETLSLGCVLLDRGWMERLAELVDAGRMDEWRDEPQYIGILSKALKHEATAIVDRLVDTMPTEVPLEIACESVRYLRTGAGRRADSDGHLLDRVLSRTTGDSLRELHFYSARLGDVELHEMLLVRGADVDAIDGWGRSLGDVASEHFRGTVSVGPMAGSDDEGDACVATPTDTRWKTLCDATLKHRLRPDMNVIWDHRLDLRERALSFHPGARLLMASHEDWKPEGRRFYWLQRDDDVFRLDGTSPPIHAFNANHPPALTEATVVDYLKFFMFFVRAEKGPFLVVDTLDGFYLPESLRGTGDARSDEALALGECYRPPRRYSRSAEDHHRLSVMVLYSDGLFIADTHVHESGMVEMVRDWPVRAELGVTIDAPI